MVWKLYNMEKETYTLQDLEYGKKKQKKIKKKKKAFNWGLAYSFRGLVIMVWSVAGMACMVLEK